MKIIARVSPNAKGKQRLTVELDAGEELVAVRDTAHYQLGEPLNDIVPGHMITSAVPAHWCAIEQKWIT